MASDYPQLYAALSDDELLNTATQAGQLLPEAQSALADELRRRKLSPADVSAYATYLKGYSLRPDARITGYFRGFGTRFLGKREFREDGSFVSTIWIVIFLIPVFPLSSARLRGDCDLPWWGEFLAALHSIVTPGSSVIERLPSLHRQQVLSTYAFVASLFLCSLLFYLVASDSRSVPSMLIAGAIFLLLFLPYVLRREARRQVTNNDTMSKVS